MRKKLIVVVLLLLLFQIVAYGAPPSAFDVLKTVYYLEPGTNVEIAYDMLGPPDKKTGRIFTIPPALRWYLTSDRTVLIFLSGDSVIKDTIYSEIYDQMEPARQRYEEFKDCLHEIKRVNDTVFRDYGHGIAWLIENSVFGVEFEKVSIFFGSKHVVRVVFVAQRR